MRGIGRTGRIRRIGSAALLTLAAGIGTARAAEPSRAEYWENVTAAHVETVALENAWYRLMQQRHTKELPELLAVTLQKAVLGRDVQVELIRSPVLGLWAQAWAPNLNRAVHDVTIRTLACEGDASKGKIKADLDVHLCFEGDALGLELMGGLERVSAGVTLNLKSAAGQLSGEYALTPVPLPPKTEKEEPLPSPLQGSRGTVVGTFVKLEKPLEAKTDRWAPRKQDGLEDLYALAKLLERTANRWYQRIRALEMLQRYRAAHGEALKQALLVAPDRPKLKLGTARTGEEDATAPAVGKVEIGDLGGLDDEVVPKAAAKKAAGKGSRAGGESDGKASGKAEPEGDVAKGLAIVKQIAARARLMREMAARYETATEDPKFLVDSLPTDDPEFGPWFGEGLLPATADGVNRLPAEAGGGGPQDWRSVSRWEALGPFPLTRFEWVTPLLPDLVAVGGESCRAERLADYSGKDTIQWQPCPVPGHADFGYIVPPCWFSFNPYYRGLPPVLGYREYQNKGHYGLPHSTAFLRCAIESPKDVELWAAIGVNRRGRVWIEDRLLWQGPSRVEPLYHESVSLLRIPFRQGLNRLTLRLDVDWASPYCWLRLCLRGSPRSAAEAKAKAEAVAAVRKDLKPDRAVGWRGDGTGIYRGVNPPIAWNQKQKQNVLWHTPMEYFGNATPVTVPGTDRLFVMMDPHWLVCLDKNTGKELWRKAVTLLDLLPEAERKKGWALHEAWWKARQERDAVVVADVTGMKHRAPKWLSYQWYWAEGTGVWAPGKGKAKDEREGAPPELIALLDKRDELEKAPDPNVVQDELNRANEQIEKIQARLSGGDANSPQAKEDRLQQAERAYVAHLRKFSHVSGMGGGYWQDYTGWTFATPVTDGKYVWLKTGTDVAACYDLDGNEKWKVQTWGAGGADHTLCSPRLVEGKFIMQLIDNDPDPKKSSRRGVKLVALDALTGVKVWEVRDLTDNAWNDSSPGVVTLTDGKDTMKTVVTTCGTVVRADDGKVLVVNPGVQGGFASPLVQDDTVIFGHAALAPIQFLMEGRDRVGFRRLWAVRGGSHGLLDSGGAVLVDGRICHTVRIHREGRRGGEGIAAAGLRAESGPGEGWRAMEAYDLATGRQAGAVAILRKGGNQWSPASATDKCVYHILGDHIFQSIGPKAPMDMVVVTREEKPLRLANNAIDRTYGAGAIEGERIYIRGYYGVTCVGYTGEEGKRYEARTVARNLLDDLYADRPQDRPVRDVPMTSQSPLKDFPYGTPRNVPGARNCYLLSGFAPHRWWMLGPLPPDFAEQAFAAFGAAKKPLQGDETVKAGGKEYVWGPVCQSFLQVPGFKTWELDPANFTDIHRMRRVVDLGKAIRGQAPSVVFLMAEISSAGPQTMRFEQTLPGVRAWIGGVEVKHGDRVKFGTGVCQVTLEVKVQKIPADGLWISPRFWDSEDVKAETSEWEAEMKRRTPYLDAVIQCASDSPEAAAAQHALAELRG